MKCKIFFYGTGFSKYDVVVVVVVAIVAVVVVVRRFIKRISYLCIIESLLYTSQGSTSEIARFYVYYILHESFLSICKNERMRNDCECEHVFVCGFLAAI